MVDIVAEAVASFIAVSYIHFETNLLKRIKINQKMKIDFPNIESCDGKKGRESCGNRRQ